LYGWGTNYDDVLDMGIDYEDESIRIPTKLYILPRL
ncbi:unnamed protein product, partial [marine sediment metagenome]